MLYLRFALVPAEDSPASCARCRAVIDVETIAVRLDEKHYRLKYTAERWLHVQCAIDVNASQAFVLFTNDKRDFAGRLPLEKLATARHKAIINLRNVHQRSAVTEAKKQLSPALDPEGRPRLRVVLGAMGSLMPYWGDGFAVRLESHTEPFASTIVTRLTEYVLVGSSLPDPYGAVDPSQSRSLLVLLCDRTNAEIQRECQLWINEELPAPLLWAVRSRLNGADPDRAVAMQRERMEHLGFLGDDCASLVSDTINDESLRELGVRLDEHRAQCLAAAQEPSEHERVVHRLERQVALNHRNALPIAIEQTIALLSTASVSDHHRQRIALAGLAAMRIDTHRGIARVVVERSGKALDPTTRLAEIELALVRRRRELPANFEDSASVLFFSGHGDKLKVMFVRALQERRQTPKVERILQRWLARMDELTPGFAPVSAPRRS